MTSLILYGCEKKLTHAHKIVKTDPLYFVRADLFHGSCEQALEKADPKPGETVLNTVEIYDHENPTTLYQ